MNKKEFYRLLTNFPVTGVCRGDLQNIGYDITNVADKTMKSIAEAMEAAFCDGLFWDSLEEWADYHKIPVALRFGEPNPKKGDLINPKNV
ncbi:MAG TPA: hypothetical protein VH413_11435 [Verrucomicrobiae bacterium]|jgi:hypothetical protein|nr:hypothetical protein [Verrucomicrobiae bacterium]